MATITLPIANSAMASSAAISFQRRALVHHDAVLGLERRAAGAVQHDYRHRQQAGEQGERARRGRAASSCNSTQVVIEVKGAPRATLLTATPNTSAGTKPPTNSAHSSGCASRIAVLRAIFECHGAQDQRREDMNISR